MGSEKPSRWSAYWYLFPGLGALALALLIGLRVFVYQPFYSPSDAMSPTINVGDNFIVSKVSYRFREPLRGDLVVFYARNVGHANYVKRVVGLPGDRVRLKDGVLLINGTPVQLRRVGSTSARCAERVCHYEKFEETISGGRSYQVQRLTEVTELENTDVYRVPPGHYFVLGDNRDNSMDSRTGVGFVAGSDIVGRPVVRYRSGVQRRPTLDELD